jgi:phosphate transport system permease protein
MSLPLLLLILVSLGILGFALGRRRALASAGGDRRRLHSLPAHYGADVLIWTLAPALALVLLWQVAQPLLVDARIAATIPAESRAGEGALTLVMSDVRKIAGGLALLPDAGAVRPETARGALAGVGVALASEVSPEVLAAARRYRDQSAAGHLWQSILALALALGAGLAALARIGPALRARNAVERAVLVALTGAALVAILTTVAIVLSLVFNTAAFFRVYPWTDFFFGTVWSPSFGGGSQLGILPLLWGTLYISLIALLVAVPIGLFAAVHLSEYAGARTRALVKPLLEVLAGIPTIVYGLFALVTVGPLLVQIFGPDTLGWMKGGTAVMTAGLVMGIMLIPFVSSLSDDIINAVPQSLRDGSYGLGATRSETVRQVILPAALPGIVGAVLLAASRAIGETMIVVLGAGAAARLSLNPFEAMTTVTAKIVSQLTGDADFSSPEALVAFALAMTLFVLTLGLNVLALWIVRRYREQYE